MKPASITFLVSAAIALTGASQASAATNLGETFDPTGCATDTTYIQTVDPTNAYRVPFDGVITSWSYQADLDPPTVVKLKLGQVDPSADLTMDTDVTIVAESAAEVPSANALASFPTQIPVETGDRIGEYVNGGGGGCSRGAAGYTDHFFGTDFPVGESNTFSVENFQQDIAAVLEPDADHDGFGDDSQDQCPTNASTQAACPLTPAVPVTPVTPAKKKKCKKHKKKHRSAESAKQKKCKKKKKHR